MDAVSAPLGRISASLVRGIGTWSPIEYDPKLMSRISRSKPNLRPPDQIQHAIWTRGFAWTLLSRCFSAYLPCRFEESRGVRYSSTTRNYFREYLARNRTYARRTKSSMLYKRRAFLGYHFRAAWLRFCLAGLRNLDVTGDRV